MYGNVMILTTGFSYPIIIPHSALYTSFAFQTLYITNYILRRSHLFEVWDISREIFLDIF